MDSQVDHRSWVRAALAVFAVGWGANQFAPLLYLYRTEQGVSQAGVTAMFSVYIVGLLPTLLVAGRWSDRHGRRVLMRPVLVLSLVATAMMLLGPQDSLWLYFGRFLAGLASGAAFGAGSAWVRELTVDAPPGTGARRAAIALTGGFGLGGLVAGVVAEFAPAPTLSPYVPHLILGAIALVAAWNAADPYEPSVGTEPAPLIPASAGNRRFLLGVAPWAALVFGCASMSFAVLADLLGGDAGGRPTLYAGVMVGVTLGAGVLVQPGVRRLAASAPASRPPIAGLIAAALGMAAGSCRSRSYWASATRRCWWRAWSKWNSSRGPAITPAWWPCSTSWPISGWPRRTSSRNCRGSAVPPRGSRPWRWRASCSSR